MNHLSINTSGGAGLPMLGKDSRPSVWDDWRPYIDVGMTMYALQSSKMRLSVLGGLEGINGHADVHVQP